MRERTWFSTVDVMNLSEDRREGVNVVDSRLFPVLLLLKVWSEGSDPCSNIDLVLLLLESICALEGAEEVSQLAIDLYDLLICRSNQSCRSFSVCLQS